MVKLCLATELMAAVNNHVRLKFDILFYLSSELNSRFLKLEIPVKNLEPTCLIWSFISYNVKIIWIKNNSELILRTFEEIN